MKVGGKHYWLVPPLPLVGGDYEGALYNCLIYRVWNCMRPCTLCTHLLNAAGDSSLGRLLHRRAMEVIERVAEWWPVFQYIHGVGTADTCLTPEQYEGWAREEKWFKEQSLHIFMNAWKDLPSGIDDKNGERGYFGVLGWSEALHQMEKGLIEHAIEYLIKLIRAHAQGKRLSSIRSTHPVPDDSHTRNRNLLLRDCT